ncbi:MAG: gliding motility-associated C-terminal domain-containing protein [Chryseolinea sp.]
MSQNFTGYNWYFGPQGIQFSKPGNTATLMNGFHSPPAGTGGSAVANSTTNGDLLFYTDGDKIYDVSNKAMPQGTGLGADVNANQAVVIGKVPGQDNQYYVFVRDVGGTVSYRIVDLTAIGNAAAFPAPPLGDAVSAANTAVAGLTGLSDAMIVVPGANGDNFWIITHANGSPDYKVTLVNPTGPVSTTTFSNIGLITDASNFTFNPTTNQIAVAPGDANRDVEIVNFDTTTGQITFQQQVVNSAVNSPDAISDIEWSSDGKYLYVSREGGAGVQADLIQYDLNQPSITPVSVLTQPNTIFRSYGLQMAPDSSIYHLYQATSGGPILMGKVSDTDSVASLVTYTPKAFAGNQTFNTTQFSSFAPRDTVNLAVTFTANGLCANTPTAFFPTVSPGADSLVWNFGDGSDTTAWSPIHTYANGGSFNPTVTAYLNGQMATSSQPITITNFDTKVTLVQDTTACSCELPFPKAMPPPAKCGSFSVKANVNNGSGGTPQLQWYGPGGLIAGATSATLTPDSAGYYYLVATVGGCSTYAGVNIKEYGQQDQRANIWYFGNHAGIDFNPLPNDPGPRAISNPVMNAPEGTSTISDRNGQVVFFTDGDKVWNRDNVEIATGIGGDPASAQSTLIVPVPGDETLYYIFTSKEVYNATGQYEVRYSLFDLKLNGGTGGLVQQNVLLFARSTERLTGNANWLIAHEYGNNNFRSYKITVDGISSPVVSSIGSDHSLATQENGQGYMELGGNNKLAVALSTPGTSNVVEIFDFADSSGVVSNFKSANLNTPNGEVYGLEFAGQYLFATVNNLGGGSQIQQISFDSLANPQVKKPPFTVSGEKLGAIQSGPDGQIYVAVDGAAALSTITIPPDTTTLLTYNDAAFPLLGGSNSNLGLPNFIQNLGDPVQGPSISVVGECIQDSIRFSGTATDAIDKFQWTVKQGATLITSSTEMEFAYLFTAPGLYNVTLELKNRCGLDTVMTQALNIKDVPPDPSKAAVLCKDELVLDANPTDLPGLSYLWSTKDTTETITVNRQGRYRVTVTNAAGCTTDGQILAADNRPVVDLGNDLTICQNTTLPALDAQNPGATYAWTVNGAVSGITRTHAVNTSVPSPPTFEYEVIVTDPVTTCFVKDSVIYTINPNPVISAPVTTNPTTCGANDGTINMNIVSPAGIQFTYSITGPSTTISDSDLGIGPIPTASGLGAGSYGITVADQVSGCAVTTTASVNDAAFTVAGSTNDICDPMNIDVVLTQTTGIVNFPFDFRVLDVTRPTVPAETGTGTALTFSTDPTTSLPSNSKTYIVEVTSNGCVASSPNILINHNPKVPTNLTPNVCGDPVTINSSGGTAWTWSGPGVVAATANLQTVQARPPAGDQIFKVRITDPAFCALDTTLTVTVQPPTLATIGQSNACTDQVTVTATPNGNYLYRWFRNGTIDNTLGGTQVFADLTNDGQQYSVTLYSPITGCNFPSNSLIVQVDGELDVSLSSTTPCEGSPFTLTAAPTTGKTPTFAWAFDGSTIIGESASTLQDQRSGKFAVTATAATCIATADITIFLAPATPGLLNDQAFICPDPANPDPATRSVILRPGADGTYTSYDWLKDGVTLGITTPTLEADEPGLYSVNLLNTFDCPSSDKTNVLVQCDPVIVGPNAFRPTSGVVGLEGDFVNQSFKLFTFFIDDEDFQVFVFNRWGEMIFTSTQREFRWNGGYNNNTGQLAPAGTYSYVVHYKSSYRPEKGIQEKRGGVVLLR